jgi:adenine phosphoribosyltransferase
VTNRRASEPAQPGPGARLVRVGVVASEPRERSRDRRARASERVKGSGGRKSPGIYMDALKSKIRHVPDFPKAGILFYDVTTLLRDPEGFRIAIDSLALPHQGRNIDVVVGIESRGFILGAAVADRIHAGFVPVRKLGKLPSLTVRATYDLEYGTDSLEMHRDAVQPGQRVLIVDDLLATGGTARATVDLVKQLGGDIQGIAFLIELLALNGRARLQGENVSAVLQY